VVVAASEAAVVVAGLVGEEVSVAEVQVAAGKGFSIPLSESELRHLAKVIEELEGQTEGEIRLMLVGSSMVTGHLFRTLFGWILALCLLLVWLDRHHLIWASSFWLLAGVFVFAGVLAASLSRIPFFIRAFSLPGDLRRQVWNRAELEFYREGLANTKERTGILLFLSILERQAVVLADQGIAQKLPGNYWENVVSQLLEGPKKGEWVEASERALRECGRILTEHFPASGRPIDELPNTVIVKP
jgi:putative membrane protein